MANTCTTCQHAQVKDINKMLLAGISLRNITEQFALGSHVSLLRHKDKCIPALFAERDAERRQGLLNDLDQVKAEIEAVKAEFGDNGPLRERLLGRYFTAIELEAKLTGAFVKDAPNPADSKTIIEETIRELMAENIPEEQIREVLAERYPETVH